MDDRRPVWSEILDVTRVVVGGVGIVAALIWATAGARVPALTFVLAAAVVGELARRHVAERRSQGREARWDALKHLGALHESLAWAAIVAGVVTLAIGVPGALAGSWAAALLVGVFLGVVAGLWLAIRRRFEPLASPSRRAGSTLSDF